MDSEKLNFWVQIVGIVSVVASLFFVGFQLKQTHEIALAGQYQERSAVAVEYWLGVAQDEAFTRTVGERFIRQLGPFDSDLDDVSPLEFGKRYVYARMTFTMLDNHHFQYTSGFYDDETWAAFRAQLHSFVTGDSMAALIVRRNSDFFRGEFRELCQLILDGVPPSSI